MIPTPVLLRMRNYPRNAYAGGAAGERGSGGRVNLLRGTEAAHFINNFLWFLGPY